MDKSTVSSSQRETHTVKVRTHVQLETAERTVDEKTAASECFIRETISKKHLRRKERRERDAAPPSLWREGGRFDSKQSRPVGL